MTDELVMTLMCADRPGLIHDATGALLGLGANIVENAQFVEPDHAVFCMRTVFDVDGVDSAAVADSVRASVGEVTQLSVRPTAQRPRVLVMVSKFDHCLVDLLYRWQTGSLPVDIALVVSNHPTCQPHADAAGVPFVHLPVTRETKAEQEARLIELIEAHDIDLVVLARYMQILSDRLCDELDGRAINIHHSFLPGFKGAKPYHQAYDRGVKIIGATAHFVTADLDEGPIIEQDVTRVNHAIGPAELVRLGQDTERLVLARAVRMWAEDRVLRIGDKTVVFAR